jgi:hypothetical protein
VTAFDRAAHQPVATVLLFAQSRRQRPAVAGSVGFVHRGRFELALQHLRPSQGEAFERLASEFLVDEFPNLRTTASPSGDRGRDAFLQDPEDETVMFQYSIQSDWPSKIRSTTQDLKKHFPEIRELVYVTNHIVGAKADSLRSELRKNTSWAWMSEMARGSLSG